MRINGSEILIECLKEQGVDTVFGYPGGAVLNIYDALYRHSHEIRHILTAHEQGAVHAADGYARASGRVGVCIATSGPGATNLVTGIATAMLLVGTLLLAQHTLRTKPAQVAISHVATTHYLAPAVVPVAASAPNGASHTNPCATPSQLQTTRAVPVYRAESSFSASFAPSHPAPVRPLTAQERALARLVQTADPKLLASLEPGAQAKLQAQEIDDFNKFFATPPTPPQPADSEPLTNTQQPAPQQGEQI